MPRSIRDVNSGNRRSHLVPLAGTEVGEQSVESTIQMPFTVGKPFPAIPR